MSAANPDQMKLPGELGCFEVQAHSFPLGPISLGSTVERKAWEPRCVVWVLRAVLAGPWHRSQQGNRRTQHCLGRKAASMFGWPWGQRRG